MAHGMELSSAQAWTIEASRSAPLASALVEAKRIVEEQDACATPP
ncbi:hypothetical protein HNR05_000338 [Leifsonia psychrotolerans]|uniref:Uncharacterized protein n=1 Tax=Glaciibacter psychrotolerans TaxID=670054 RepID=A0A7Z0J4M4_9MICO|nr:hypothetical protein [Leifsonia psychrotolerans]